MTAPSVARSLPPVYAAAVLRLAFPLLLLPLMAQRLGADEFGRLGLVLVWAGLLSTLVEGGFLAAATRLAVRADGPERASIATRVFSARVVLSAATVALAVFVGHWLQQGIVLLAVIACALGWQATWYLQASQQLHRWAWVEIGVYAAWALAVWAFAHSADAYLAMQAVASALLAAAGWAWLRRDLRAPLWSAAAVKPGLALGGTMLPVSIAGAAYSFALPAVASAQMARSELGLYYLADRLVRALLAAADPVFQIVYPRIVQRFAQGARAALVYTARWALAGVAAGALLWAGGLALWHASGRGGDGATPVLTVLGALLPLLLGWKFFGYWMLGSARFDAAYRACMIGGALAGLAGAWAFATGGALPLAYTAIGIESFVIVLAVAGIGFTLHRQGR